MADALSFEEFILGEMETNSISLKDAIIMDMMWSGVDTNSVFDMTDYLEFRLEQNMDKVQFYMQVACGIVSDWIIDREGDK